MLAFREYRIRIFIYIRNIVNLTINIYWISIMLYKFKIKFFIQEKQSFISSIQS